MSGYQWSGLACCFCCLSSVFFSAFHCHCLVLKLKCQIRSQWKQNLNDNARLAWVILNKMIRRTTKLWNSQYISTFSNGFNVISHHQSVRKSMGSYSYAFAFLSILIIVQARCDWIFSSYLSFLRRSSWRGPSWDPSSEFPDNYLYLYHHHPHHYLSTPAAAVVSHETVTLSPGLICW